MDKLSEAIVVLRFDEDGEQSYYVFGSDIRLFIVDERAPNDRVYEVLSRDDPAMTQPTDAEVEAVARAMCVANKQPENPGWRAFTVLARAAIVALDKVRER